jgi:hypothetical protein
MRSGGRLMMILGNMVGLDPNSLSGGHYVLVAACVLMPLLLLVRRPWVPLVMQLGLLLGSLEWIRTLMAISAMRQMTGAPVGRMMAILAGVALFTGASALVFLMPSLRRRYDAGQRRNPEPAR